MKKKSLSREDEEGEESSFSAFLQSFFKTIICLD